MEISRRTALAGAAAAFAVPFIPAAVRAAESPITIRMAAAPDDDITPILYGQSSGIFKKNGLDVQFQTLSSGSATAAAVAGGSIEIGKSSLVNLISAHVRGVGFQIIAPASVYTDANPIAGFIVAKDSPIKTARDLNGKTVSASSLKDLIAVATQAWIDENGGDSKTVHFLEIPSSAVPPALEQHKIDGATVVTPALAEALDTGKTRLVGRSFSAIAKRFLVAGWFTTKDYMAKNPEAVKRFVTAFREAAAYTDTHRSETVALLANFSKIPESTIKGMVRSTAGNTLDPKDIQPVIEAALRYKVIEKSFPASELIASVK